MQCTWSSAVPCVSSSSAMARSWAAKNLQLLPVLWVLPDSTSWSRVTMLWSALVASLDSHYSICLYKYIISIAFFGYMLVFVSPYSTSWGLDKVRGQLRLSTVLRFFLQGTSHRGACTHHGLLQVQNASEWNWIVSALSLHCAFKFCWHKPSVSLLTSEKAAAVLYMS